MTQTIVLSEEQQAAYNLVGLRPGIDEDALNKRKRIVNGLLHPDKQELQKADPGEVAKLGQYNAAFEVIKRHIRSAGQDSTPSAPRVDTRTRMQQRAVVRMQKIYAQQGKKWDDDTAGFQTGLDRIIREEERKIEDLRTEIRNKAGNIQNVSAILELVCPKIPKVIKQDAEARVDAHLYHHSWKMADMAAFSYLFPYKHFPKGKGRSVEVMASGRAIIDNSYDTFGAYRLAALSNAVVRELSGEPADLEDHSRRFQSVASAMKFYHTYGGTPPGLTKIVRKMEEFTDKLADADGKIDFFCSVMEGKNLYEAHKFFELFTSSVTRQSIMGEFDAARESLAEYSSYISGLRVKGYGFQDLPKLLDAVAGIYESCDLGNLPGVGNLKRITQAIVDASHKRDIHHDRAYLGILGAVADRFESDTIEGVCDGLAAVLQEVPSYFLYSKFNYLTTMQILESLTYSYTSDDVSSDVGVTYEAASLLANGMTHDIHLTHHKRRRFEKDIKGYHVFRIYRALGPDAEKILTSEVEFTPERLELFGVFDEIEQKGVLDVESAQKIVEHYSDNSQISR